MPRLLDRLRILYSNPRFRILFLLSLLLGFAYSFVLPFMSMFCIDVIGMSNMQFGLFMTLNATGGVVIGTTLARYSDTHFSRRSMMLCGGLAGCIGYAGYAFIHNFAWLALVGTFVIGLSTITFAQLFAHAREVLKTSGINATEQSFYMNVFRMYFSLAWTIGPGISAWMMVKFSVRGVFVCAASIFLLFTVVVIRHVPRAPPPFALQAVQTVRSRWWLLRRVDLFAHLGALTLMYATSSMCMSNLPLYILDTLHGTKANVGFAYSIAPLFELPLMLYFGWLATRHDTAGILRIGVFLGVAYYVALSFTTQPWHIYMCQLLSAAMVAVVFGLAITYFQSHLPHHPGIATNLYANANRVGSTAGYFMFGLVAGQFGYHAVFEVCALLAAFAFLLMLVPVSVPADEAIA